MKSKKRKHLMSQKASAKEHRAANPGDKSNYAKKHAFLHRAGGHGFDYVDKPWK